MSASGSPSSPTSRPGGRAAPLAAVAAIALLVIVGALVAFKAGSALKALAKADATGTLGAKPGVIDVASAPGWAQPLAGAANYFVWVGIALAFGVVIGAAVRALVPDRWLARSVGAPGVRGQLFAAVVGAPLMLCSCCVVPVFEGVYERTRRLGPSLGLMFAAPALNPAALALTFMLFPASIAWARLALSLVLVLVAAAAVGALAGPTSAAPACDPPDPEAGWGALGRRVGASFVAVARRSLPAIAVGVVLSVALAQGISLPGAASGSGAVATTLLVAAVATLLALPTFGEIPLALALGAAGAPDAAIIAMLVAGPSINLPSILALGKAVSPRAAAVAATVVFAIAALGGATLALG